MAVLLLLLIPLFPILWGGGIHLLSLLFSEKHSRKNTDNIITDKDFSFTVLIPANNEEKTIAGTVRSMLRQTYRNFDLYVILDNCTDGTAEALQEFENINIIEKTTPSTCKGDALNYAAEVLRRENTLGDAVVIMDADSTADPNMLEEMNLKYRCGAQAVMAGTDILNPDESIVTQWYTLYWKMVSEESRKAHSKFGLSCNMSGCGMSFLSSLIEKTKTITEDVEYFFIFGMKGIKVDCTEKASVYQEQPETLRDMLRQLYRWMNGVREVNIVYGRDYFRSLVRNYSFQKFDALITAETCSAYGAITALVTIFYAAGFLWKSELLLPLTAFLLFSLLVMFSIAFSACMQCGYDFRKMRKSVFTYCVFVILMGATYVYSIIRPSQKWMKVNRMEKNE